MSLLPADGQRPRLAECIENWPDCREGDYDPRCCRFPKSCSCDIYDEETQMDDDRGLAVASQSSPHQEAMARVDAEVSPQNVEAIRVDERMRLAHLLQEGRLTISEFAGTKAQLVDLVSFMLTLNQP